MGVVNEFLGEVVTAARVAQHSKKERRKDMLSQASDPALLMAFVVFVTATT